MTQATLSPHNFETIGRQVSVPNAPLETVLAWADVIIEDGQGGDKILLSGIHQSEDDKTLCVGATFMSGSDSTVGDTFTEVTVPSDYRLVEISERFRFDFINNRADRSGQVYFPRIGSLAICWQRPSSARLSGARKP